MKTSRRESIAGPLRQPRNDLVPAHPNPRNELPKKLQGLRILMDRRNGVDARGSATQGVVPESTAPDRDPADRPTAEGYPTNCAATHSQQQTDRTTAECHDSEGQAAKGENAPGQTAEGKHSGGHVSHGEKAARMTAHFAALGVRSQSHRPERQTHDLAR